MVESALIAVWLMWSPVLIEAAQHAAAFGHGVQFYTAHVTACLARP